MRLDITQRSYPALHQLLYKSSHCNELPFGCSECPFAVGADNPNIADPDEGHYLCGLLGLDDVWGEEPRCKLKDWQERAIGELT